MAKSNASGWTNANSGPGKRQNGLFGPSASSYKGKHHKGDPKGSAKGGKSNGGATGAKAGHDRWG